MDSEELCEAVKVALDGEAAWNPDRTWGEVDVGDCFVTIDVERGDNTLVVVANASHVLPDGTSEGSGVHISPPTPLDKFDATVLLCVTRAICVLNGASGPRSA